MSEIFISGKAGTLRLDRGKFYYLCSAGVGDTMLLCGFYDALKQKLGGIVHLLIKESHEFLMKMYGIHEYSVIDFSKLDLLAVGSACKIPERGRVYVAHPHVHREMEGFFAPIRDQNATFRFIPWFIKFLGLPASSTFTPPKHIPELSVEMMERCERIAPLEQIAIFSPEATSMPAIPMFIWRELAEQLRKQGIYIVSNVMRPENCIPGTIYLHMSAADAVALGYKCDGVYSIRSGYCDALYRLGRRLHVFYPSHSSLYIYSLNEMFGRKDIDEKLILMDLF